MTQTQSTEAAPSVVSGPRLNELENERAVDRIEGAERGSPHCLCGSHMLAVVKDDSVWLECSTLQRPRGGIGGLLARLQAAVGHSRSHIMELPATN